MIKVHSKRVKKRERDTRVNCETHYEWGWGFLRRAKQDLFHRNDGTTSTKRKRKKATTIFSL